MTDENKSRTGHLIIAGLVFILIALHQDVWNWDSRTLVFGYMPLTLFYHVCISLAASATWFLATKIAWFDDKDDAAPAGSSSDAETGGAA